MKKKILITLIAILSKLFIQAYFIVMIIAVTNDIQMNESLELRVGTVPVTFSKSVARLAAAIFTQECSPSARPMAGLLSCQAPVAGSNTTKVSAAFTSVDRASDSIARTMVFFVSSKCFIRIKSVILTFRVQS